MAAAIAAPGPLLPNLGRFAKDGPLLTAAPTTTAEVANAGFSIQTIGIDTVEPSPTPDAVIVTMSTPVPTAAQPTATAATQQGGDPDDSGECRLLGSFAIFVQLALGGLALLALVYKRWRERPQRPVKIWFFDVSKQVVGSVLVHIANVFMSMLTSGRFSIKVDPGVVTTGQRLLRRADSDYTPNPCSFYLLNLAIDTTLGIPILILLLRVTTGLVAYTSFGKPPESIQSGNYGNPPSAWWWLKQSIIYFCGLFGMKICVLVVFVMLPWISRVGDWALGWTEGNEQLQIVFVMMLFPLIMNALQYYIIDSFIKMKTSQDDDAGRGGGGGGAAYDRLAESVDGESSDQEQEDEEINKTKTTSNPEGRGYDPALDGDSPSVVGSSSSRRSESGQPLPKELYPHE